MGVKKILPYPKRGTPHGDSIVGICHACDNRNDPIRVADAFVIDLAKNAYHLGCIALLRVPSHPMVIAQGQKGR